MRRSAQRIASFLIVVSCGTGLLLAGLLLAAPPSQAAAVPGAPGDSRQHFETFAVLASPALRRTGASDLVEAELGKLPGVRIVEREHLYAAVQELTASQLLGSDSTDKRLKLGRLVKADALVILADDDSGQPAATTPDGRAVARVVISDCGTGARLFVGQAAIDRGKPDGQGETLADLPAAVAEAVVRTRAQYPSGVRWIAGTSPFVNRGLTHDYDWFQDRFAALLNNALSLRPGVAVLEIDEARSIGSEQQIGGDGAVDTGRIVPLIIEGDFQVTRMPSPTTRPRDAASDMSVVFTVSFSDGKGIRQKLQKTVPIAEVPGFLTRELVDVATGDLQLKDRQPISDAAQFDALVRRADEFSWLGSFQQSISLREAGLLLRPADARQHERLVDEYQRIDIAPAIPGQRLPQLTARERERDSALRNTQWRAGMEHLEYLIRNRLIDRPQAIKATGHYRARFPAAIPDGPPYLREFFSESYPAVLALEPGKASDHVSPGMVTSTTQPIRSFTPEEIDQIERTSWLDGFFGQAARERSDGPGSPLTSADSSPTVLGGDAADFLADMLLRCFPDDVFLPPAAGCIFERVPGSEQNAYPLTPRVRQSAGPTQLPPPPAAPQLDPRQVAIYVQFLERVEKSGKGPYIFWVRLARIKMQCLDEVPAGTTRPISSELALRLDALEKDYRGLKLHGTAPGPTDPLLVAIARVRARATGARPSAIIGSVQIGVPSTRPVPLSLGPPPLSVVEKGERLWFVPIPVHMRSLDGKDAGPRNGIAGWAGEERLVPGGPALDIIWSSRHVLFWQKDDLVQEVFNATTAARPQPGEGARAYANGEFVATGKKRRTTRPRQATITDVKWDGKRVWVAYTVFADPEGGDPQVSSGLAVIEADGHAVRWVGKDEGLPPSDLNMLIHPISEGRVVAIGSFGATERGWCAAIRLGNAAEATTVNVFHTAVTANNDLRSIDAGGHEPNTDMASAFRPTWVAECRPPAPPGAAAAGPRLLLVGRAAALQSWPLVIDLETLKVSVTANPFTHDASQQATQAFAAPDDGFLEVHDASIYRYQLAWSGSRLSGTPVVIVAGDSSIGPFKQLVPAGDYVYLPGNRAAVNPAWIRYNVKAREVERIEPDYLTWRAGPCEAIGFSSRFGLIGWGQGFCRLVAAHDRPGGALKRTLFLGPTGIEARFEPDGGQVVGMAGSAAWTDLPSSEPVHSADLAKPSIPLPPELTGPAPREPTLVEVISQLDIHEPGVDQALSRLAELKPDAFPPEKKNQVSNALVPLVTMNSAKLHAPAMRAFAVWHTPESEPPLLARLQDADTGTRWRALEAIGACKDPVTIPDIVRQLPQDGNAALGCLAAIGPASEPALLSLIAGPASPSAHAGVIDALALVGTSRSVPALQAILYQHPDRQTAEVTRQALEMIQQRK